MAALLGALLALAAAAQATPPAMPAPARPRDGAHDFDFDIGTWRTDTSRLRHPLTGSGDWIEMTGVTVVEPVLGGRGNLATLESDGPTGHLQLISLRLYDPRSHQWSLTFATAAVGERSVPMVGDFATGRGLFYDQEEYEGRMILVRFTFTPISRTQARSEQAFSADGGRTWETNFINRYTRIS